MISNDYGELVITMMMLRGQEFAHGATLLLPERLYSLNRESLPVPTHSYDSLEDVLEIFEDISPDVFFLFSGFLFPNNQLLSRRSVAKLVRHVRRTGCQIVTSDPFLRHLPPGPAARVERDPGPPGR
jgi:hypothetical protein